MANSGGQRAAQAHARCPSGARNRGAARRGRHRLRRRRRLGLGAARARRLCRLPAVSARSANCRRRPIASPSCAPMRIPAASIKLPPSMALSLGALVTVAGREGEFAVARRRLACLGAAYRACRRARSGFRRGRRALSGDALSLGRPDVGGNRLLGPDADGAYGRRNRLAARQRHDRGGVGHALALDDPATPLRRGDLVFWKGHVGVMRDAETLLHANGWHMRVVSEPLSEARRRIAASGGGDITSVKRLG